MASKKNSPPGTLVDYEITRAAESGELISSGFQKENVRQCCYEARAGSVYYDLSDRARRIDLASDEPIIVKPKQSVTIITAEKFSIPADTLARILTKGSLFSLGISPVNTYADPGFDGNLGITFYNFSTNYLKIPQGASIAKIEFSRLGKDVEKPYVGQHGYHTQIWPIPTQFIMSDAEIQKNNRIQAPEVEIERSYGGLFGDIYFRIRRYERWIVVSAAFYFLAMIALLTYLDKTKLIENYAAIGIGVVSNVATAILFWVATRFRGKAGR